MQNLSVENLSRVIDTGDTQGLMGPDRAMPSRIDRISEKSVENAMSENGMSAGPSEGSTFSDLLRKSVDQVNGYQVEADQAVKELVAGRNKNIHETLLAVERADSSLKLMMQVRNKVLDAYREIMKMQV